MKTPRLKKSRGKAGGRKFFKREKTVFSAHNSKKESPSISRPIPDERRGVGARFVAGLQTVDEFFLQYKIGLLVRNVLLTVICVVFLVLVGIVGLDIRNNVLEKQRVEQERVVLTQQRAYWEHVVAEHHDYRDGYMQLALLSYQLGNTNDARLYVERVLSLDPNFEKGREMEKKLQGK